ncbi:hypothetical protein DPEC_G00270280 [Dallia pectoralis]|uniref:Uncharacterized protein n=1 Tax=Dallia pectoralis TaxID=75939 RepID=A0ACC2FP99_DALPE|nr:hypothetical protein DPEC_G00270280 [Dallia pectoralis]
MDSATLMTKWTKEEVHQWLTTQVNINPLYAYKLLEEEVSGEDLDYFQKKDLLDLKIKHGPAVKIVSMLEDLRNGSQPRSQFPKYINRWTKEQVCQWLKEVKVYNQYVERLLEEEVSGDCLFCFQKKDLLELGIKHGPAVKIIGMLEALNNKPEPVLQPVSNIEVDQVQPPEIQDLCDAQTVTLITTSKTSQPNKWDLTGTAATPKIEEPTHHPLAQGENLFVSKISSTPSSLSLLQNTLDDLQQKEFKRFKSCLKDVKFNTYKPIAQRYLEDDKCQTDIADMMIKHYKEDALKVTLEILDRLQENKLSSSLRNDMGLQTTSVKNAEKDLWRETNQGEKLKDLLTCGGNMLEYYDRFVVVMNKSSTEQLEYLQFLSKLKLFCVLDFDPNSAAPGGDEDRMTALDILSQNQCEKVYDEYSTEFQAFKIKVEEEFYRGVVYILCIENLSMSASVNSNPSPPALPKPEMRRIKSSHSDASLEDDNKATIYLPELKGIQVPVSDELKMQPVPQLNDFIPEELVATLTSTICPHSKLGPPKLTKTPKNLRVHGMQRIDTVWHHPVRRKKYKYFLDQPTSMTGAGRDISFLCDAVVSQRERILLPPMAKRGNTNPQVIQKDMSFIESLIPEEYHIVKNKGVQGLECYDDTFTVLLEDEERRLKVFPSMRPSGRLEAVQLMKVMDEMLDRAGVNQEHQELTGLSQMQGLLELVQVEQNIYNIVFHELIRQVSVMCAERGQLLAKLRQRYVSLLDRIPRQLKGLHTETLAQRALDRRLTEEIVCFRHSIAQLNTELCKMREHDEILSKQAEDAQLELVKAVEQSQRNSVMVEEYHDLYEMQRKRLERQVARLMDERDLWSRGTYNLALKVIKLNNIQLANRLHISEQTWTKTAEHFTVFLMSKDEEDLNQVMELTERWKEQLKAFMQSLKATEDQLCVEIQDIKAGISRWHTSVGASIRSPELKCEKASEEQLCADLKQWSNALTIQCERYGGEELLSCQETLNTLGQLQEAWVEVGLRLFRRHLAPDGDPPKGQEAMRELGMAVTELHKQLGTRINGESGIHRTVMSLVGIMDFWVTRLKVLVGRTEMLPHCDWLKLEKALGGCIPLAEEALKHVHSSQTENERLKHKPHVPMEMNNVFNTLRAFSLAQDNFFDCENRRLCEEVDSIHTALTRWMVDLLLQLVPDHSDTQKQTPLPRANTFNHAGVSLLEEDAKNLSQKLDYFSKYITSSCQVIVEEEIQKNMSQEDTENKLHELGILQRECEEWRESCQILLSDMKGRAVDLCDTMNPVPNSTTELLSNMDQPAVFPSESLKEQENNDRQIQLNGLSHMGEAEDPERTMESSLTGSIMKLIGHDGNITEQILGKDTVQLHGTEDMVARPHTVNGQKAFDALATVELLQKEILGVEARANSAEERAIKAEEALQAALEKIQDLEIRLQVRASREDKVTVSKTSSAPVSKSTVTVTTPEPRAVRQKPETSPKQSKPKKR